jgi:diguanylate cyclase (GGDEF)-like protein
MQIRYPDVNEEAYRLHYLKQDRAQCRKVMRVVMWASLPLAYVDFAFLSVGGGFFSLLFLRTLIFLYSWWTLKRIVSIVDPQALDKQVFRWSAAVLLMQFISNLTLPRDYFGHYLVDTWLCVIYFIVIPLPLRVLRPAIFGFISASLCLLAYKILPVFAYAVSVMAILPAGAYTGHAISSYLHRYRKKILSADMELERRESTDPVTGIANRREFMRVSENELQRHVRLGKPLSLLIIDLDHFKKIRENYGPLARDIVLVEITKRVKRATRNYDCIARYGTEEFCVLLPEASAEDAARIAARTWATIVAMPIAVSGKELKVSANIGIATMLDGDTTNSMLKRADEVLIKSKIKKNMTTSQKSEHFA